MWLVLDWPVVVRQTLFFWCTCMLMRTISLRVVLFLIAKVNCQNTSTRKPSSSTEDRGQKTDRVTTPTLAGLHAARVAALARSWLITIPAVSHYTDRQPKPLTLTYDFGFHCQLSCYRVVTGHTCEKTQVQRSVGSKLSRCMWAYSVYCRLHPWNVPIDESSSERYVGDPGQYRRRLQLHGRTHLHNQLARSSRICRDLRRSKTLPVRYVFTIYLLSTQHNKLLCFIVTDCISL